MGNQHEHPESIGTQRLPGTGGDLAPTDQDVEGHGARRALDQASGHPDGASAPYPLANTESDADVEGHLYTGGPSTRGEFIRRAPGDGPHGEG